MMRYSKAVLTFKGNVGWHPSEDDLEEFVFGRLDGAELDRLEEHLLVCETCRKSLTETENFVASTRAAARKMLGAPAPVPKARRFSAPALALAGALAILFLAVSFSVVPYFRSPQTVMLVAERGGNQGQADAGRPLNLELDVSGLESSRWLEIVDAEGKHLHAAPLKTSETAPSVLRHRSPALPAGQAWIRLYRQPSPTSQTPPLREFNLRLQ